MEVSEWVDSSAACRVAARGLFEFSGLRQATEGASNIANIAAPSSWYSYGIRWLEYTSNNYINNLAYFT